MASENILEGKKILIVDDEVDILESLEDLLDDCDIETASTFEAAKDLLEKNTYDAAILDIMGVRGFDLLEVTTEKKIPALMLTAHGLSPENEGIEPLLAEVRTQQNGPAASASVGDQMDEPQTKTLQDNWDPFGKQDPMWSILTRPDKKGNNWQPGEFFGAGIQAIEALLRELKTLNLPIPTRKALDFGCGVGRLTQVSLSSRIHFVTVPVAGSQPQSSAHVWMRSCR